jgi:hypothetical protein
MIHFVTVSTQDNCMRDYLSLWGRALQPRVAIVYYEDLLAEAVEGLVRRRRSERIAASAASSMRSHRPAEPGLSHAELPP